MVEVFEELTAQILVPHDAPLPQQPPIPLSLKIVSLWERSALAVPEDKTSFRVRIYDPNGKELSQNEVTYSMLGPHLRSRNIVSIQNMPAVLAGRYEFRIYGPKGARWMEVAVVPLHLKISVGKADPIPAKPS